MLKRPLVLNLMIHKFHLSPKLKYKMLIIKKSTKPYLRFRTLESKIIETELSYKEIKSYQLTTYVTTFRTDLLNV